MAKRRILTQAQAQALVRYQPQLDALKGLMGQAEANFAAKVNEANLGQEAIQGSVARTAPALHRMIGGLGLDASRRGIDLQEDVAKLGNVANSIKAATLMEGAGAANRLAQTDAFNMADLGNRYVQAAQGAVFAKKSARRGLESDVTKIAEQVQSVLGQKGAFTAATIESLTNASAQRALQDRISRRSAVTTRRGQDISDENADLSREETIRANRAKEKAARDKARREAAEALEGGPKVTPKFGTKVRTAGEHGTVRDGIDSAKSFASQYKKSGTSRETVAKWLTQGRESQTVEVDGKKVKVPGIPKSSSPLAASIALDLAYDGQISRKNVEELWRRGITLRGLGIQNPRASRRKSRAGVRRSLKKNPLSDILF